MEEGAKEERASGDRRERAGERARHNYLSGYNCAQSVLEALGHAEGIEVEPLVRMVTGLGGGLARRGEACGALTAGVLWLSMVRGTTRPEEPRGEAYELAGRLIEPFRRRHGRLDCMSINGLDFSREEHRHRCSGICAWTARRVIDILEEMNRAKRAEDP
jgi:C_GCAxxG_C_C family probable redox protein